MDTLQNMRVFMRVVESGSFTAAAQHLNTTTAYASRAVSDLEAHLHTRLLNRTTRRIALTEAGERYLQRCEQILAYVEEAEAEASDAHARPSGKLRMHAMASFGGHYVVPAIGRYRQRYPEVSVDLTLAQRIPDLLDEGYDVSVVLGYHLPDSGLVSQRLGSLFSIVCASPAYLEKHGVPKTPSDLTQHICLRMVTPGSTFDKWSFDGPHGIETFALPGSPFQVNGAEAMAIAVREGMGIAVLPTYTAMRWLRNGDLVWVMPEYTSQPMNIYALYSSREYLDAKIRTWVDFLREEVPQTLAAEQAALRQFVRT
ncbi:LysR family transcriptional regulator [Trinickia caryophylli]|uniref:Transcriptional regulator, LysR family n=1 Tax=Trinickia caryophylli TaxID=28094 RepID=A0A1X7E2B4_TRICW|nr:LysR family transcriptional regulator [Trinickia caryophylli]PMS14055.1 LysR family transcriptional regulator [Trinickia caryophylli]TRX17751.1 LysR family transcriptional regulator [Trinickia caryophylli]WQE11485.1 LysR family transcriptional regulator [Trinickia caryophylli]SMF25573.1 transcriptional regulator, LysR family [Trinickia caryophylli]GLU32650.1 LysR family transcriptional regulator [Trinickia caryophylli]